MALGARTRAGRLGADLTLILLVAVVLLADPRPAAAEGPYEPNDFLASATGPLERGSTYAAALEGHDDRDLFSFYVTSPAGSRVELTVMNLGGSGKSTDLTLAILDSAGTPIAGESFIRAGTSRAVATLLAPQKYYAEVAVGEGYGDSYILLPEGGVGAFGSYAQIAGRCGAAQRASAVAEAGLSRVEARFQRITARLHRTSFRGPAARRSARLAYRKSRLRLRSKRRAAFAAAEGAGSWCSIRQ